MRPVSKVPIRAFGGKILGFLETDAQGNQQVREFNGKILGNYDKHCNVTRDFGGRIVSQGNTVIGFLYNNINK